ncbi:MAG: hypothetical protein U0V70_04960 [Terriglobia bacterium]
MTHYERMLRTIRGEPTDKIPWAPRMDLWCISLRARQQLPPQFAGLHTAGIADVLDVACHAVRGDFTQARDPRDLQLRGFGLDNHPDYPYRIELHDFPIDFQADDENLRTTIHTPKGDVTTHLQFSAEMKRTGISLPFVKEYAIRSVDDFEAVAQIFEHLEVIPTPEAYGRFHERVGPRGLAVANGLSLASPMHLILHDLMPMEEFFYAQADVPQRLTELTERMTPFFDKAMNAALQSKAEVFFCGGNYDDALTPPPFFKKEIAPWLRKWSGRVHEAGRLLLTHCDGENRRLMSQYLGCGFDLAESVCPSPMTYCSLAELRAGMPPPIVIWGGIPAVALLDDSMDEATFEAYLDELFANLGTGERLILGVSDNVPPDANLLRLQRIKERVEAFGPIQPSFQASDQ